VSRYKKGKTNLDFTEARDSEWQLHQLGSMQVCTSLETDNHASTPPFSFFTGDALHANIIYRKKIPINKNLNVGKQKNPSLYATYLSICNY